MTDTEAGSSARAAEPSVDAEGYERGLHSRQIQMIAIGGAIGTGLFLGAGGAIEKAGPSLVAAYAVAGVLIFFVMRALGELLMYRPVAGSFPEYAREFFGPFAGFVTGWTYWVMWVVTGMAEITAAGVYVQYWWSWIPQWVTALVVLLVLFAANLISVKLFGEFEFWFSMIKVTAIIGMILVGIGVLLFGFGAAGDQASVSHLWSDGGFAPNGVGETLLVLQIVMFAFLGVELVGVTAGEAQDPEKVLPRAINTIPFRIGLFYIGALLVILSLAPWTDFHAKESPFVLVFDRVGIPAAAAIINFVVLTAALSSCNSGLYSTGRMLRTLAVEGQAPPQVSTLSSQRVPAMAITVSAIVMGVGVLINALVPDKAFMYITSVATVGALWTWGMIVACQMRYRRAVDRGRLEGHGFRMPGAPYTGWAVLAFLAMVVVLLGLSADTRIALYVVPIWVVFLVAAYIPARRGKPMKV
ncbi:amino acid permease [Embleya sp. NPDC008237]|uniref:amino acid permease n=1 Tax=Embleya sp. NPDC008237 TaxID=3363978 RepID=UPI0036EDC8CD